MILDIETKLNYGNLECLNISYFDRNGEVAYKRLPLDPATDGYVWEYAQGRLDRSDQQYVSWDNRPVRRVKTSKINKYTIEEILSRRSDELGEVLEFNIPNKYIIDIETEITDGFPDPEYAHNKITAIAIANCTDKRVNVLGLRPLTEADHDKIQADIDAHFSKFKEDKWTFRYTKFDTEYDMLYTFFAKLIHKMPCITGWNFTGFDWKYMINRAERIKVDLSKLGRLMGRDRLPQHKLIVDYLEIVKKWDRVIKIKENFKLDYIAEKATGLAKIKYNGTLKDLYEKDFVKFIFYNAVDTILVHYIDQKLNTMTTFLKLASISQVEINRAFSPVWVQESLMTREFYKRGKVMVNIDKDSTVQEHFTGAYVKDPVTGLHEWVCCYDFSSLYPNVMIQFNISPEMYIGKNASGVVEADQIICANGNVFDNKEDSVMRTILKDMYAHRKAVKTKMQEINKEVDYLKKYLETQY